MNKFILTMFAVIAMIASAMATQELKAKDVELTGKLVCLGCELKGAYGAAAQCSAYGHGHAFKVESVKEGKKEFPYYTFLPNDKSKPLADCEAFHGKMVTIKGLVFPGSQILEVRSFAEVKAK